MLALLLESAFRSLVLGLVVWTALKVFRIRNSHAQAAAWTLVLLAALSMPILMQWRTVPVPAPAVVRFVPPAAHISVTAPARVNVPARQADVAVDWPLIAERAYLLIALLLLVRMATGLVLTWRLVRSGIEVNDTWTAGSNVRSTAEISVPVTFGSTILVPAKWSDWDDVRRRAVLIHERSHIKHGHFYIQLLAGFHRAIFWFNPLSWWLLKRLAELAETVCDDAAVGAVADRPSYAAILLDFARKGESIPAGVAMARRATVSRRVERILHETNICPRMGWKATVMLVACLAPVIVLTAGCSLQAQAQKSTAAQTTGRESGQKRSAFHLTNNISDDEPFVIMHGGDTIIEDASGEDRSRANRLKARFGDDYIWFLHDSKAYYITDPALIQQAREYFRDQEALGAKQAELGARQAELGKEQARLGVLQAEVHVKTPDLTAQLARLEAAVKALRTTSQQTAGKEVRETEIGELQDRLGELQGQLAELQERAAEKQSEAGVEQGRLGELQGKLGAQQGELGEEQGKLGEEQSRLAELASQQVRKLLDSALRKGLAKPVE